LDEEGKDGYTPLALSCQIGSIECVSVLLRHGASSCFVDSRSKTPLHYAAQYGRHEICQTLFDALPEDFTFSYSDFCSLVGIAFQSNHTDIGLVFLSRAVEIFTKMNQMSYILGSSPNLSPRFLIM
jgi:ankyrin repeat protein